MKKETILARKLRKNMTPQELKMWSLIRNKRYKNLSFKRQYPIGAYIVDFICKEKWLILEIDGGQHNNDEIIQKDLERTNYLKSRGFTVLRFWNDDIDKNIDAVFNVIDKFLDNKFTNN